MRMDINTKCYRHFTAELVVDFHLLVKNYLIQFTLSTFRSYTGSKKETYKMQTQNSLYRDRRNFAILQLQ